MRKAQDFSRKAQERKDHLRVAIQGEPGSNSHLAVLALVGEQTLVPCAISAEVFERLAGSHSADAAVLPIENSLHGAVADHYDLLLEHEVVIVAETALRIRHALITRPDVAPDQVRRVLSHPVALSQCRRYFLQHPEIQAVPSYDTAGSVKQVMQGTETDVAAIAAPYAAEVYGATILQRDLEDDAKNFTRFLLLERSADLPADLNEAMPAHMSRPADKMSIAFAIPHRPGSLAATLNLLAETGADLTRIESRPVPGHIFIYIFFVYLSLCDSGAASDVVHALRADCSMLKVLGRYASVELL